MRMAESGQLGWVEREVEPRQWADQVEEHPGESRCNTPEFTCMTGVSWCAAPGV